ETMDEAIKFPIWTDKRGELEEAVIAGPTCDSADIMYEDYKYGLPLNLAIGDRLYWLSTGAYTTSYSSIEFNGFPPLEAFYVWSSRGGTIDRCALMVQQHYCEDKKRSDHSGPYRAPGH